MKPKWTKETHDYEGLKLNKVVEVVVFNFTEKHDKNLKTAMRVCVHDFRLHVYECVFR